MAYEEFEDDFEPKKVDFEKEEIFEDKEEIIVVQDTVPVPKKKRNINIRKILKIAGIVFLAGVLIYLLSFNSYFKNYKTNFIMNIHAIDARLGISETWKEFFGSREDDILKKKEESRAMGTTYDNESYLVPFENASNASYVAADGGVIAAKSNYLAFINHYGKEEWKLATSVVNPILTVDGKYIALAENGGTKVCLYQGSKLVFAADAQNTVLNANVSSRGDVIVVTKKEFFKGAVEVFNKNGERVFSWGSGTDTVVCADISPSGRKIAVGFVNAKDNIKGSVQFFNIDEKESYKTVEIPSSVVFKVDYIGESLNVFCDNRLIGLSVHGSVLWDEGIDGDFSAYSIDTEGNKAVIIDKYNLPMVKTFSKRGREKKSFVADELPDFIDIRDNLLLYNNTRMIIFGKPGREQKYVGAMDVKGLKIIDSNTYLIVYSNSIEFVSA